MVTMMATTHMLSGMALALPVLAISPELGAIALFAGLVGGLVPDLDLYFHHRKTLHFPVGYSGAAFVALVIALVSPSLWTVGLAFGLLGAAVHSVMDIYGGGLELEPWRATSERAVFSHVHGRWIRPKRVIPYDGSPEDLALVGILALPLLLTIDGIAYVIVLSLLAISAIYVALRKRLARLTTVLVGLLPRRWLPYIPERYVIGPTADRSCR